MKFIKQLFVLLTTLSLSLSAETLENGFQYHVEKKEGDRIEIELTLDIGNFNETESEIGTSKLLGCSLLQETKSFDFEQITDFLMATEQDVLAQNHVEVTPGSTIFRFSIPNKKDLATALHLIGEMMEQGTLSPFSVEMARNEMKEFLEFQGNQEADQLINRFRDSLDTYTSKQLREHYSEWYRPELMTLLVRGTVNDQEVQELVHVHFSGISSSDKPSPYHCGIKLRESYTTPMINRESKNPQNTRENANDSTVVIEGKIFMNTPSYIKTRHIMYGFGGLLILAGVAIGLGIIIPSVGIGAPAGITVMTAFITAGVSLFTPSYHSDPAVIKEKRAEDKQYGFKHAYAHRRAHLTLTPYERRNMFIRENSTYANLAPQRMSDFNISTLADVYDLSNIAFRDILYPHEIGDLQRLKEDFVVRRNNVSMTKKLLEQELNFHLIPHQTLRDMALDQVRKFYEENPAVIEWRAIKAKWDARIDEIWADFNAEDIDEELREELIATANEHYEFMLNEPELRKAVEEAKAAKDHEQKVAIVAYEAKVIECKALIHYDVRMAELEAGKWALYAHHNQVLVDYMSTMTLGDPNFVDFIDLR